MANNIYSPLYTNLFAVGFVLSATTGSFTDTGVAAALTEQHQVSAAVGTFTETGDAATLAEGHKLPAAAGAFVETGDTAALSHGYALQQTTPGIYSPLYDRLFTTEVAFTELGDAAALTEQHALPAATGAFAETGNDATLGMGISAATGAFAETGDAAALAEGHLLAARGPQDIFSPLYSALFGQITFMEHGDAAAATIGMPAGTGAFTETGDAAALDYGYTLDTRPGHGIWSSLYGSLYGVGTGAGIRVTGNAATLAVTRILRYGVNQVGYGVGRDAAAIAQMETMGCTTMRIGWDWSALQPTSSLSSIFWSGPDAVVAACQSANILPVFCYFNSPSWANGGLSAGGIPVEGSGTDATWQASYAAFVAAFVSRYGAAVIHEAWNEPNENYAGSFWMPNDSATATPSPTQYKSLFDTTRVAVKAVNPQAILCTGGVTSLRHPATSATITGIDWLTDLMNAGIVADMFSIHPYTSGGVYDPTVNSFPTGNSFQDIGPVQDAMVAKGYGTTMLKVGEFGNYSAAAVGGEAVKAGYLTAALTLIQTTYGDAARGPGRAGVVNVTYFSLNNATNGTSDTTDTGTWTGTPLVGPNTMLPAGLAFQEFTRAWAPGVFTETGNAATFVEQHRLSATPGVFTETGDDAVLGLGLPTAPGVFTETGDAAAILAARTVPAAPGTFTETGNAETSGVGMPATVGAFVDTGEAAILSRTYHPLRVASLTMVPRYKVASLTLE